MTLTALILLPVMLTAIGLVVLLRDEPRPDLSDLPDDRPTVADEDNAFLGLLDVAREVTRRRQADAALNAALNAASSASPPTADDLATVVTATGDLRSQWEGAISRPGSLVPATPDPDNPPFNLAELHALGHVARHWAADAATTDARQAVSLQLTAMRAGQRVAESHGTLIVYLTGCAMANVAARDLAATVCAAPILAPDSRRWVDELEQLRFSSSALAACLRSEAHVVLANAETLDPAEEFELWVRYSAPPNLPPGITLFYKPHQSAQWVIDQLRSAIAQVDRLPVSSISVPVPATGSPSICFGRLPNPDNAYGRFRVGQQFLNFGTVVALRPQINATISAAQALIATRAWDGAHGALPPDLRRLVPEYLPCVPDDSCDGAPIRYSPEFRAIWSVGATGYAISSEDQPVAAREIDFRLPVPAHHSATPVEP